MRQGASILAACAALAMVTTLAALPVHARGTAAEHVAAESKSKGATKRVTMRQFTGTVTALDKTSLTVEKGGKKPRSMVFAKHAEMKTTGDLAKDAHVTVYYRGEGAKATAHRVVVKAAEGETDGGR